MGPDSVLIVGSGASGSAAAIARLFDGGGFAAQTQEEGLESLDASCYGAVVHVAGSRDSLIELLGNELPFIKDEEWILVEQDGEDDYHCTVQLGPSASSDLREFVRTLWARFSVT